MTTLKDYIETVFPNHDVDVDEHTELTEHTTIAEVLTEAEAHRIARSVNERVPNVAVSQARVVPSDVTVLPGVDEDPHGDVDVPPRRLVAAALAGAAIGVLIGVVVGLLTTLAAGVIAAVFAGAVVGVVAMIAGGGARFAGERAWQQPNVPGTSIFVVAALAEDEEIATSIADAMERAGATELRVLDRDGMWHNPHT